MSPVSKKNYRVMSIFLSQVKVKSPPPPLELHFLNLSAQYFLKVLWTMEKLKFTGCFKVNPTFESRGKSFLILNGPIALPPVLRDNAIFLSDQISKKISYIFFQNLALASLKILFSCFAI